MQSSPCPTCVFHSFPLFFMFAHYCYFKSFLIVHALTDPPALHEMYQPVFHGRFHTLSRFLTQTQIA